MFTMLRQNAAAAAGMAQFDFDGICIIYLRSFCHVHLGYPSSLKMAAFESSQPAPAPNSVPIICHQFIHRTLIQLNKQETNFERSQRYTLYNLVIEVWFRMCVCVYCRSMVWHDAVWYGAMCTGRPRIQVH